MKASEISIKIKDNWGGNYEIKRDDKDIELWGFNKKYPLKGMFCHREGIDPDYEFSILAGSLFQVSRSSDCYPKISKVDNENIYIDLGGEYDFTDEDYITKIK